MFRYPRIEGLCVLGVKGGVGEFSGVFYWYSRVIRYFEGILEVHGQSGDMLGGIGGYLGDTVVYLIDGIQAYRVVCRVFFIWGYWV